MIVPGVVSLPAETRNMVFDSFPVAGNVAIVTQVDTSVEFVLLDDVEQRHRDAEILRQEAVVHACSPQDAAHDTNNMLHVILAV